MVNTDPRWASSVEPLSIKVPSELKDMLRKQAEEARKPLSEHVRDVLQAALKPPRDHLEEPDEQVESILPTQKRERVPNEPRLRSGLRCRCEEPRGDPTCLTCGRMR